MYNSAARTAHGGGKKYKRLPEPEAAAHIYCTRMVKGYKELR
jgi:hypothetical protein